jgi:hypothetical protein
MIELSEQTVIEQLVDRLSARYPSVPGDKVAEVVNDRYARFDDRPIRDYIPLFVERAARSELAQLSSQARADHNAANLLSSSR